MKRRLLIVAIVTAAAILPQAYAAFPGQNGRIAFQRFYPDVGYELFTANPDFTHETQITSESVFSSDWSADGTRIAWDVFEPDGTEQISAADGDGSGARQLTSGPGIHESPSFSPGGSQIVYDYSPLLPDDPGFSTALWIMNADGSGARQLVPGWMSFDVEPKVSPDGYFVAFVRLRLTAGTGQQTALFVARLDGTGLHRLTGWRKAVESPDWSPDGEWLTFYDRADHVGNPSVFVIRRDGTDMQKVYAATARVGGARPVFSPDGSKIMFACVKFKPAFDVDVCVMNADGSDVVDLTNTLEVRESRPSWGTAPVQ
jgi:Tol biopolymer transport system component